jgi:glycosyltransferase involved in cell wall biosynthesis
LNQTFFDFEFIIIDDGSTDQSFDVIHSFKDKRIVMIKNDCNLGNYPSRNKGMKIARGKYICVMDGDDISMPNRLERQFMHMEQNPETGILGSFIINIPSGIFSRFITEEQLLKVAFLSNNQCSHPSLILRKEFINRYQLQYNEEYFYSADFDLCARGFRYFKVQNIPEILLKYRRHPGQISNEKFAEQQRYADKIRIKQLKENLGFKTNEIMKSLHLKLMRRESIDLDLKTETEKWIERIVAKNEKCKYYDENRLISFLNDLSVHCFHKVKASLD